MPRIEIKNTSMDKKKLDMSGVPGFENAHLFGAGQTVRAECPAELVDAIKGRCVECGMTCSIVGEEAGFKNEEVPSSDPDPAGYDPQGSAEASVAGKAAIDDADAEKKGLDFSSPAED